MAQLHRACRPEGWPAARLLAALASQEVTDRERRRFERHRAEAKLPPGKTLDNFDFTLVPAVSKARVGVLASGDTWRLLLAGFGYQIMHVQRAVLERVTGTGWSLRRLAERVLRTPARFTVSGRRITMTTGGAPAHWRMLARGLATLHGALRIARAHRRADPSPGPAARTAPRCFQVPETGHLRRVNCVFRTPIPAAPPPKTRSADLPPCRSPVNPPDCL